MNLSELSLKRPVLAIVLNIIILIFGAIGFTHLGVRDYPAIDPPVISVRTSYSGANADVIESQITEPLEKSINGIAGIRNISSTSNQGASNINIEFNLGIDLEAAANDVRDKVAQAARQLPKDLDAPPEVSKADASSDYIISLTVASDHRNQLAITEYANNVLAERLQTIPGVSSIRVLGEKKYAMRIELDPDKLIAHGLTSLDVQQALAKEHVELPAGKIYGDNTELTIRTFGKLYTEEEFNNVRLKLPGGQMISLREVGQARIGAENEETVFKGKLVPMVNLAIIPLPGSNYVEIAEEFYKRLEIIKKEVPADLKLEVATDQTKFIKKSILEVEETLILSFILVVLIVFFFFRDFIIALRPLIDIPVSLIGTFFIMYLCDFSINVLTMLGIVLATGLVVDDGIVVTENIYKKLEGGMGKFRAALEGTKEIYFAVIATSITLAVVFLPIIFIDGFIGKLFREFGIVMAAAVLISCFVSLTLTPVLSVYLTRNNNKKSKFYYFIEPYFVKLEQGYHNALQNFMKARWQALAILVACIVAAYGIGINLKSELAPLEDRSQFRVQVTGSEGSSFDYMDKYLDKLSRFFMDSVPEAKIIYSLGGGVSSSGTSGVNSGFVRVFLNEPEERGRTQQEIVAMANKHIPSFGEGKAYAYQEQTISTNRRSGQAVQFVLQNNDFEKLKGALPVFLEQVEKHPALQNADVDLKFNKPELQVYINRLKATDLGISVSDISETLRLAYSNMHFGYFSKEGKQYQVIGQVAKINRNEPGDLRNLYVRTSTGKLVSVDNVVEIQESTTIPSLYHFNRYKSATISAGLAPGVTIGEGVQALQEIASENLDESFTTSLSGSSRDFAESSNNTYFAFLLALLLIYLFLAAQFESFIDPLIIILTVPLAVTGALLTLLIFGQTINIFSQIGIIMLIGLVTKNGILIVEYANQKQKEGYPKLQAVIEASVLRLRPILMTSLAMALGSLPLAMSLGAASASRVPLGMVIVGGVLFSLILTLFVIPAMYTYLSRTKTQKVHQEELVHESEMV